MLPQEQYMTIAGIFRVITLVHLEFFSSILVMFLSLSGKRGGIDRRWYDIKQYMVRNIGSLTVLVESKVFSGCLETTTSHGYYIIKHQAAKSRCGLLENICGRLI